MDYSRADVKDDWDKSEDEKPKAAATTTAAPKKKLTLKQKLAEKERLAEEKVCRLHLRSMPFYEWLGRVGSLADGSA